MEDSIIFFFFVAEKIILFPKEKNIYSTSINKQRATTQSGFM